jgi:hypothetical protein
MLDSIALKFAIGLRELVTIATTIVFAVSFEIIIQQGNEPCYLLKKTLNNYYSFVQ